MNKINRAMLKKEDLHQVLLQLQQNNKILINRQQIKEEGRKIKGQIF
jgi:hypothetical protein